MLADKRIVELLLCYIDKGVGDAPQIAKKQVTFEHQAVQRPLVSEQ